MNFCLIGCLMYSGAEPQNSMCLLACGCMSPPVVLQCMVTVVVVCSHNNGLERVVALPHVVEALCVFKHGSRCVNQADPAEWC